MIFLLLGIAVPLLFFIIKRSIFQWNVPVIENLQAEESLVLLDVRDYNESYNSPVKGAVNIPIAYLRRYYEEIPNHSIILIVANHLEKKIGIRCLRRRGFQVVGYNIVNPRTDIGTIN